LQLWNKSEDKEKKENKSELTAKIRASKYTAKDQAFTQNDIVSPRYTTNPHDARPVLFTAGSNCSSAGLLTLHRAGLGSG